MVTPRPNTGRLENHFRPMAFNAVPVADSFRFAVGPRLQLSRGSAPLSLGKEHFEPPENFTTCSLSATLTP